MPSRRQWCLLNKERLQRDSRLVSFLSPPYLVTICPVSMGREEVLF